MILQCLSANHCIVMCVHMFVFMCLLHVANKETIKTLQSCVFNILMLRSNKTMWLLVLVLCQGNILIDHGIYCNHVFQ